MHTLQFMEQIAAQHILVINHKQKPIAWLSCNPYVSIGHLQNLGHSLLATMDKTWNA